MYTSEVSIRVRYAETDKMGYVYYGNYATYYEVARTDMVRSLGLTYRSMEEKGIGKMDLENYQFILTGAYQFNISKAFRLKPSFMVDLSDL